MVVVGVVLVVVVVGPLVVVVWVVVVLVFQVWPMDPLWDFRSPLWGWGVGHRGQSPGLHYVVSKGGGSGAGLDGDGRRGVPRPWVGLAGLGRLVTGMQTRARTGSCWVAASAVVVGAGGRGAWVAVGGGSWPR